MTQDEADRVEAWLRDRFPTAEIDVARTSGAALHIEVRTPGSTTIAEIGTEHSAFLVALDMTAEG